MDAGDLGLDSKWISKERGRVRANEMTTDLVKKHNELVKPGDTVYHLGDFTFGGTDQASSLLRILHGNFKFVYGNHDRALKDFKEVIRFYPDLKNRVEFLGNMAEVIVEGQLITLCHYALRTWNKSHRGSWSLHGHSHGTLPDLLDSMSFDVGIDCHNYRPINMDRVREIMSKKIFKPIDHHK